MKYELIEQHRQRFLITFAHSMGWAYAEGFAEVLLDNNNNVTQMYAVVPENPTEDRNPDPNRVYVAQYSRITDFIAKFPFFVPEIQDATVHVTDIEEWDDLSWWRRLITGGGHTTGSFKLILKYHLDDSAM